MTEQLIDANGVTLCAEPFGSPDDPPILLVMGIGASMLWWEDDLCELLARGGRYVIRYDHRDTGRSVTDEPGRPTYTSGDLIQDVTGVLDAFGIAAAHLVGVSAGGAFAQRLALDVPDRVRSLVIISSTPAAPGERSLPGPTDAFSRFVATADVDWSDSSSIVDHQIAYARVLAGDRRPFDDAAWRALVVRDVERARDAAAVQNHDLLAHDDPSDAPLASITAPTLVIHGTADPMFPLPHGEALASEIPGARLLTLDGAGHGVERADWEVIAAAIVEHTGGADRR